MQSRSYLKSYKISLLEVKELREEQVNFQMYVASFLTTGEKRKWEEIGNEVT